MYYPTPKQIKWQELAARYMTEPSPEVLHDQTIDRVWMKGKAVIRRSKFSGMGKHYTILMETQGKPDKQPLLGSTRCSLREDVLYSQILMSLIIICFLFSFNYQMPSHSVQEGFVSWGWGRPGNRFKSSSVKWKFSFTWLDQKIFARARETH